MKLFIEPTKTIDTIEGAPCRLWTGETDKGVPVHVYVRCLSARTHDGEALADFDRELQALPTMERQPVSFDIRLVV